MLKLSKIFFAFIIAVNISINAQGYICAIGGGSEDYNDWSDAPYSWIVQKSDSGKIIIIDVEDATSWLPTYFMSFGADTAYNKTIATTFVANLQSTYDELITAKAIFIRGGDQWDYISIWKGTLVDLAIQFVFNSGGVIAGTSAGAAVLGDVDFSAKNGTVYPDEALENPFNTYMQFEDNFLKLIPNVLFDTHFIERGRHGRLIAMLYNRYFHTTIDLIGAGIDDRTAICISPNGIGEVMGSGAVSIFYKDDLTNYSELRSGYTIENLKSDFLTNGWKYDFINNEISFIPPSAKDVDTTRSWEYPLTDFVLTGTNDIQALVDASHLYYFLNEENSSNIVIISHPGFANSLTPLTDFLVSNSYNFSVLNLTSSNLNDAAEADKINSASSFLFAGDSLNVLSYLNQSGNLVPDAFQNAVNKKIPIFFFGNSGKIAGKKFIGNTDTDLYAGYRGKMTINEGLNIFGEMIFQPQIFESSDYYENRMSAVLWGMMRNRKRIGIYLNTDEYERLNISANEKSMSGEYSYFPYIIVDARHSTKVDSSTYRASGSIGPRQIVAMNNVRFSITDYHINYLFEQGRFDKLTEVQDNFTATSPSEFILYQNYPNPFNPSTKIRFSIPDVILSLSKDDRNEVTLRQAQSDNWVTLKVYDILGREIATLVNYKMQPGTYEIEFDGSHLSSGVYFYKLTTPEFSETKSMVLLK